MPDTDLPPGLHFAGVNTWLLIRYLRDQADHTVAARVLRDARETRTEDELFDLATWSSYAQFRRLLEATAANCGGSSALTRAAGGGLADPSMPEMTAMLQSLGSPEALLGMLTEAGGAGLAPIVGLAGEEVGPAEWVVREWFAEGFEPFPEYCSWAAGSLLQRARVVRTARRGHQGGVRVRRRTRVRVPDPLVPRRRIGRSRLLRDSHPPLDRAPRGAAADRR